MERKDGGRRAPRKLSARSIENSALHYLKRYAATVQQLRRVLVRKVDRSLRVHGGDRAAALGWIEEVIGKLCRGGLLDDRAYAQTKAHGLRSQGRSARVIAQKLKLKGVAQELVRETVGEATGELPEEDAARIWARKKRLGPYRPTAELRAERRQKDLAALARAGFSFTIARRVVDGTAERRD